MVAVIPDFKSAEQVIADPKAFKKKLGIRKITNQSLRQTLADEFVKILDAYSAGKSVVDLIIQIFPVLGIIAVVPATGWVIAACVVATAGHFGISRYSRGGGNDNGDRLDPLAVALFDFLAPLGLRVAALDGAVTDSERECIENYFAREWGYSRKFVHKELSNLERNVDTFPIIKVVDDLVEFKKRNRGFNYKAVSKELTGFLQEVTRANGELHDLEVIFIQWLEIALAKGKPGFFDGLLSAVGISERDGNNANEERGSDPVPDRGEEAPRSDEVQNNRPSEGGAQRALESAGRSVGRTLHWLTK